MKWDPSIPRFDSRAWRLKKQLCVWYMVFGPMRRTGRYEHDTAVVELTLGSAKDERIGLVAKILVTSPVGTVSVHEALATGDDGEETVLLLKELAATSDE
jgi:hypothetical protein